MRPPVIVGGGPAGAAAAIRLAGAGVNATLLERSAGPHHKVCGDFLSAEALGDIVALGVRLADLRPAPIGRLRLVCGDIEAVTTLPFQALGLSRMALDEALLRRAGLAGAKVLRGAPVRNLDTFAGLRLDAGPAGRMEPDAVFLATGKHDLRGVPRLVGADGPVGFKTYFALAPAHAAAVAGHVELAVFPGGYAGLQPVEDNRAVLCLVVERRRLHRAGGSWAGLLESLLADNPHLARRLAGARHLLARPVAVAGIPYGHLYRSGARRSLTDSRAVFRLGDQAAVIPSLTGDGVAIALASGVLAAESWLAGEVADAYHRRLRARVAGQVRAAMLAHRLACAPAAQAWVLTFCRLWPGLMRFTAALTRCYQGAPESAAF